MCSWDTDAPAIAKFAKIVNFHKQRAITPAGMMRYGVYSILKRHYGTKQCDLVHKILMKTIRLREKTLLQTVNQQ